ncbi:hypothetical protein G9A89_007287 [Geosiphon pyriformis]|nr:hypothetical protein G9A89_007287 [Geosiphon pyriformis]
MGICCGNNEEYTLATKFYCCLCIIKHFGRTKQVGKWDNKPCLACEKTFSNKEIWNDIPGQRRTCNKMSNYWKSKTILYLCLNPNTSKLLMSLATLKITQKNFMNITSLNTQLCQYCLIPCDFQYCNECNLIYNPPPYMIYLISEEDKPISSCALELESIFNPNLNSNNDDDKNTGSSSIQNGNKNINNSDSDSNPKIYIYSDNNEDIMPKCAHDINTGFDLKYSERDAIKLESHLCTCIDLKIALKILATTMVQLASRSSLVKKRINIRGGIIDAEYIGNIIVMLQNNSEKAYTIDLNEKIAQAIFLSLKEIIDKREIISTHQSITIPPYNQYILAIKREVKDQA